MENKLIAFSDKQEVDYNLLKKLYASPRVVIRKLENKWIFFAPDFSGLPLVVSSLVKQIYNSFKGGAFIQEVVNLYNSFSNSKPKEVIECVFLLWQKGFLRERPIAKKYTAVSFAPLEKINSFTVWLHITNNCNLQCPYCFVHKDSLTMSEGTMKTIVNQIAHTVEKHHIEQVTIKFAGGEPTLVLKKMKFFYNLSRQTLVNKKLKLYFSILSNGTLVTKSLIDFLQKPNIGIGISLDGYGVNGHDIYRKFKKSERRSSWQIILRNIEQLKTAGIKPYIMATISEASCATLKDLVTWVVNNNFHARLSVVRQAPESCISMNNKRLLHANGAAKLILAFEEAFCELEKDIYNIDVLKVFKICELNFDQPSFSTCCGIGANHVVIRTDGNLASCPMTLHEKTIASSADLLSDVSEAFSYSLDSMNSMMRKKCLHCKWFPVCVSGCSVFNQRINGSPFTKSPLHEFYQYIIPRYIKFYGKKILQYARLNKKEDCHILSY